MQATRPGSAPSLRARPLWAAQKAASGWRGRAEGRRALAPRVSRKPASRRARAATEAVRYSPQAGSGWRCRWRRRAVSRGPASRPFVGSPPQDVPWASPLTRRIAKVARTGYMPEIRSCKPPDASWRFSIFHEGPMLTLILAIGVAVVISFTCSLTEAALYAVPWSAIEKIRNDGRPVGEVLFRLRSNVEKTHRRHPDPEHRGQHRGLRRGGRGLHGGFRRRIHGPCSPPGSRCSSWPSARSCPRPWAWPMPPPSPWCWPGRWKWRSSC